MLVDDTVETVFEEALASLDLDLEGRPLVEQSSITGTPTPLRCVSKIANVFSDSLSKQIAMWHRMLSHVLGRIPAFDDEGACSEESSLVVSHLFLIDRQRCTFSSNYISPSKDFQLDDRWHFTTLLSAISTFYLFTGFPSSRRSRHKVSSSIAFSRRNANQRLDHYIISRIHTPPLSPLPKPLT